MRVAVVAMGKIGLPLAVQFASSGQDVIGVDVNEKTVDLINQAKEPFPGEAHLQEKLSEPSFWWFRSLLMTKPGSQISGGWIKPLVPWRSI